MWCIMQAEKQSVQYMKTRNEFWGSLKVEKSNSEMLVFFFRAVQNAMKFEYAFWNRWGMDPFPKCPARQSKMIELAKKSLPIPSIAKVWAGSILMYLVISPKGKSRKGLLVCSWNGLGWVDSGPKVFIAPLTSHHSWAGWLEWGM